MAHDAVKFAVMFHGQRFLMDTIQSKWFILRKEVQLLVNFYTTRFVIAENVDDASVLAMELIEKEINNRFVRTIDSVIEIHKIRESESAYTGPGEGFTFYEQEDPKEWFELA